MTSWAILLGAVSVLAVVELTVILALCAWAHRTHGQLRMLQAHDDALKASLIWQRDTSGDLDRMAKRCDAIPAPEKFDLLNKEVSRLSLKVGLS